MPPSPRWALLIAAAACGPQVILPGAGDSSSSTGTVATTSGASTTATSTSTTTGPMTSTSGPVETTTGVDPDPSTTTDPNPTTSDASSSETGECTNDDECIEHADCKLGAVCIACLCLGGCPHEGTASWGACVLADGTTDISACGDDEAVCIVDEVGTPTLGVCASACSWPCDCPPFPGNFDSQVSCEDVTGDGLGDCFIDCKQGKGCPEGMQCVEGTVCMWPAR